MASLEDFLEELSLVADIEEHKGVDDAVTLMTVHSAKGLEFDYVFVVGLEEGIFPHNNSIFEGNIEEERRLMYVAVTRASKKLWLVNTKERLLYGERRSNPVSRFIKEIDEIYLESDEKIGYNSSEYTDDTYSVGEHINHDIYGEGVIVDVKDAVITVAFKHPIGIKTLIKGHKSIKKVSE